CRTAQGHRAQCAPAEPRRGRTPECAGSIATGLRRRRAGAHRRDLAAAADRCGGARWRGVDRGGPGPHRHAAAVWRNHHPEQGLSTMADQLINQVLWPLIYILCIVLPLVIAVAMF